MILLIVLLPRNNKLFVPFLAVPLPNYINIILSVDTKTFPCAVARYGPLWHITALLFHILPPLDTSTINCKL